MGKKQTFLDILGHRLSQLPDSPQVTIALDPQKILDVTDPFLDGKNRAWQVFFYDGNDLILRNQLPTLREGDTRILLVAYGKKSADTGKYTVDLSYIPDLVDEAIDIIDCSPSGLLSSLSKDPLPPDIFEEPLLSLWSENIEGFRTNLSKYQKLAGKAGAMNRFDAMAIALMTSVIDLDMEVWASLPARPLDRVAFYLEIIAENDLNDTELAVFRNFILGSDPDKLLYKWCEIERSSLIRFIYLGLAVIRYAVPKGFEELQRLGLLEFDITQLGMTSEQVLQRFRKDIQFQTAVLTETEKSDALISDIDKLAKAFKFGSYEDILTALAIEPCPAIACSITKLIIEMVITSIEGRAALSAWPEKEMLQRDVYPKTAFTQKARRFRALVYHVARLEHIVASAPQPPNDLISLMTAYRTADIHLLELLHDEAFEILRLLKEPAVSNVIKPYLEELMKKIDSVITTFDKALAQSITSDFAGYVKSQRLNTQILRNLIQAGVHRKEKVWIIILDGMRLDTWDTFIWPRFREYFDIAGSEQLYLATLPSYTDISRVSFLAGKLPPFWKDYQNNFTSDHNILLSRLLDLGRDESKKKLKIVARAEEKAEQVTLDFETAQYRCTIFNISDDWIHNEQGSLVRINEIVKEKFEKMVLEELISKIDRDDIVVVTSDHGFMEMRKEYSIRVNEIPGGKAIPDENIMYRYIDKGSCEKGVEIKYDKNHHWTIAVGHEWFERSKQWGKRPRYSHGGISMAEMVVPAVRLHKRIEKKVELLLSIEPLPEYSSGDTVKFPVEVKNQGTIDTEVVLTCRLAGRLINEESLVIPAGTTYKWPVAVVAEPKANQVYISAQYTLSGRQKKTEKRQVVIPIKELGAKVEVDTSALDVFDNI